jgi:hypothetical protein
VVLVTGSWKLWLAGLAASLAIFGVVYFTAIKPSTDTANQAIKQGMQQTQQAIHQAQQQLNNNNSVGGAGATDEGRRRPGPAAAQQGLEADGVRVGGRHRPDEAPGLSGQVRPLTGKSRHPRSGFAI